MQRYVAAVYVGAALGGNFMSYKMCPNNAVGGCVQPDCRLPIA